MIISTSTTKVVNVKSFGTALTLMIQHTLMMLKAVRKARPELEHKESYSAIALSIKCRPVVTSLRQFLKFAYHQTSYFVVGVIRVYKITD